MMSADNDIVERLRALSRREHDDLSIGDEAAAEIVRLRGEVPNVSVGVDVSKDGAFVTVVHRAGPVDTVIYAVNHPLPPSIALADARGIRDYMQGATP